MKPEDANTGNSKVLRVVYNHNDFSIAYLYLVREKKNTLAVRWNYNYSPESTCPDLGSPNQGVNPKWLYLPEDLYVPTLYMIKGRPGTNESFRLEVLNSIISNEMIVP